jgi:hypothetical protein
LTGNRSLLDLLVIIVVVKIDLSIRYETIVRIQEKKKQECERKDPFYSGSI